MPKAPPSGDPLDQRPPWAPYPEPIATFVRVPGRLLSPLGTAPALSWWELDGHAVPNAVRGVFVAYSDDARRLLWGTVQQVGMYTFAGGIGARLVVVTSRAVLVVFPEFKDAHQQVQTVLPHELAATIRNGPSLPPAPGAPAL